MSSKMYLLLPDLRSMEKSWTSYSKLCRKVHIMKYYRRIEMDVGNHDFPRLARESNFYFNLYRGRVDWKVIDSLDIDRLIRERDLESLQSVLTSIVSCNLTNEYDVKVLDPNFVKLFRLAQLAVDYLQYCRNYLDHCVIVLQEQLQVALHEVEQLQQERNTKEEQIKQLTKKLKTKIKDSLNKGVTPKLAGYGVGGASEVNAGISSSPFRCLPCGKIFVSAVFLQRHIVRRHPEQVQVNNDTENLHLEIRQLQERLQKTEQLLEQQASLDKPSEATNEIPGTKENVETVDRHQNTDNQIKIDRAQNTDAELSRTKDVTEEPPKSKQQFETDMRSLLDCLKQQSEEIESLKTQLKSQHLLQESLWQNRMDQLELRHQADIESLRSSLSHSNSFRAPSPLERNFDLKECQEKQVQYSPPTVLDKGTQMVVTPERISPHTSQEAFTKPSPSQRTSVSPVRPSPMNFSERNQLFNSQIPKPNERLNLGNLQVAEAVGPAPETKVATSIDSPVSVNPTSPFSGKTTKVVDLTCESTSEASSEESRRGEPQRGEIDSETDETSSNSEKDTGMLSSLANKPEVIASLREDVHGLMLRSLQDFGVDPEWSGIPSGTYQSIKATLQHQRTMVPKDQRNLAKLRQDLSREVDSRAREVAESANRPAQSRSPIRRKVPARPPPPRNSAKTKSENEYTAEPRREECRKTTAVYEEVPDASKFRTEETTPLVPPTRKRSPEKTSEGKPTFVESVSTVPVPPPRILPSTAELLADMERLRQQGTLLRAEGSSMAKSNLKSSVSTGNIKKRVVFEDEKNDFRTMELSLSNSEFGTFHSRLLTADTASDYSNKLGGFSGSDNQSDNLNKFDSLIHKGSGEPEHTVTETNVKRLAKQIELQLQNRPKAAPSVGFLQSTSGLHSSQLDLILDDLSSS